MKSKRKYILKDFEMLYKLFSGMKELMTIFLILLINSYAFSDVPELNMNVNKINYKNGLNSVDSLRSNKKISVKPVKALKKRTTLNHKSDSLTFSKDSSSLNFLKETVRNDSAHSAVFKYDQEKEYFKKHTMRECTLTTVSGKIFSDVRLSGLNDSTVTLLKKCKSKVVFIKDIRTLKINGRGFWRGALMGSGSALLLGFIAGNLDTTGQYLWDGMKIGLALVLPLAIIGGIFESKDTVYDISAMNIKEKKRSLKYLFSKY